MTHDNSPWKSDLVRKWPKHKAQGVSHRESTSPMADPPSVKAVRWSVHRALYIVLQLCSPQVRAGDRGTTLQLQPLRCAQEGQAGIYPPLER